MRPYAVLAVVVAIGLSVPVRGQAPAPVTTNPTGEVSLRVAVDLALAHSPDLMAFDAGRREAEAARLQAARLPNPVLHATLEDVGRTGTARSSDLSDAVQPQATVQLSQLVELGGERAARQRVAGLDRDLANWDYEAARLDVLTRVSTAFLDVLAGQQAVAHTGQSLEVARQVRQTVATRVAAGVVSPIEETRADVLVATAEMDADRARRTLDARRRQLAAQWGSASAAFSSATGDLDLTPGIPPLAALEAALSRNPAVARWVSEVERRQAALVLARSARVPDITVSAGYRRFTAVDSHAFVVGASVPIPWFDRNRDGIRAAEAAVDRARHSARGAERELVARLAEAHRVLASAGDDVATLRSRVVPAARSVFEAVREGYELGRFGLMDVLDAQRMLSDANGRALEALTRFHQAMTTVERLVGQPLSEVSARSR